MALPAPETHAKIANLIAPKGGKQSVPLYAVRLLARALHRTPFIPRPPRWRDKAGTPVSRHVRPRVRALRPSRGR